MSSREISPRALPFNNQTENAISNPHLMHSISFFLLFKSLIANRSLIYGLVKRDVVGRYRGSVMGLLWSFFNPILMLSVYTFVFSVVFQARWAGGMSSRADFALVLYAGLLLFNLFSECFNRAPGLILSNVNYVKKVIFPLEILPIVALGSATFNFAIGFGVWIVCHLIFFGVPSATIFQLPLVIIPLIMMTLGISWFLASLGVYIRDVSQFVNVVTTVLMFLSPIFYPITALPEEYRSFMHINPLTFAVEQARNTMIFGNSIDWVVWCIYLITSVFVSWLGFAWFQKTRKGFADVL